jgi:predicted PurR-regulated permease PerM
MKGLWRSLNNSHLLRFLLLAVCGWVMVQFINYFYSVIAIFTSAVILAVLMNYPVRLLCRYLPRGVAITLVVLSTIILTLAFVTLLGDQIVTQGENLLQTLQTSIQSSHLPFKEYLGKINIDQITNVLHSSLSTGLGIVGGVFSNTFTAIFLLVIATYMLIDGEKIWQFFLHLLPADAGDRRGYTLRERCDRSIQKNFLGFLRAQVILMLILSTASFLVFTVLGVQFSLILATVMGVLTAIPGIGATLGVIVVTVLVLVSQGDWMALKVVIAALILQQIQDNYVNPRIMGKALEINPVRRCCMKRGCGGRGMISFNHHNQNKP